MADAEVQPKEKRHRSPAYPFISLKKAVERAEAFYKAERRHAAPLGAAAKHWGYGEKSSGGLQTVSALKQYGLMADEGGGGQRKVKLTERAFRILLDEVKDSPARAEAIKQAALHPKLYAEMFKKWGLDLPSDETIRTFLRVEKEFNDDALNGAIKDYKDTIAYANVTKSDKIDAEDDNGDPPKVNVGDYIQWESQGAWVFPQPKLVVSLSDDGEYVFVEGEKTGIPMEQVTKTDPPAQHIQSAHIPATAQVFPPNQTGGVGGIQSGAKLFPPGGGIARELSSLPEGEAILQWPAALSPESVQDLEDWLELVIKKLKRRYAAQQEQP